MRQAGESLPASGHVLRIIWPFVPVVVALALFSIASLDLLSAARAFVAGESQWSKGQKNAVLHLLRYGEDRNPADFTAYLAAAGRFCLYAQEIVPAQPDAAASPGGRHIELLLRMLDERGRLVPPMAFVPACERYNLMPMIDRWVVETAFRALAGRQGRLPPVPSTCLARRWRISSSPSVREQAQRAGIALDGICFEITETAAIANLAQAGSFIRQLQRLGCSFALDDFGAGMSSFAYLKHLPAAYLKIDGSFVRDMLADPVNLVMVEVIQRIGHAMAKKTIAEFVESEAMLERLRELGVDLVQGFHIGPPQPFAPCGLAAMVPSAAARTG